MIYNGNLVLILTSGQGFKLGTIIFTLNIYPPPPPPHTHKKGERLTFQISFLLWNWNISRQMFFQFLWKNLTVPFFHRLPWTTYKTNTAQWDAISLISLSSSSYVVEVGHLLTCSSLTYPEFSSKVCHDSFCQLVNSVSLAWVIYYRAFNLHVLSSDFTVRYLTAILKYIL